MTLKKSRESRTRQAAREQTSEQQTDDTTGRSTEEREAVDRTAQTQVGQAIQTLNDLTQRLPRLRGNSRSALHRGKKSSPERIQALILALGDTEHPDHTSAVNDLVEIGAPAVPALCEALSADSWLTAYRAAETLGYIGDGRATGALIQALHHVNSNVRWSAVRALAQLGDIRALLELRRLAQEDLGRTSWGESVAGTAQSALDQMHTRSVWTQTLELVKTAITSVLLILSLVLAFSVWSAFNNELDRIGVVGGGQVAEGVIPPDEENADGSQFAIPLETATLEPVATVAITPTATPVPLIVGNVLQRSNVRPEPSTDNQPITQLVAGDEVVFVGQTADGDWYLVRLSDEYDGPSEIDNPDTDDAAWISQGLVSEPEEEVPVVDEEGTPLTPTPTTTPTPDDDS